MIRVKKFWRCSVCLDIHFGVKPPEICPTCLAKNAFVLVDSQEALTIMSKYGSSLSNPEQVMEAWKRFSEANEEFMLTQDKEMVETLARGVCDNNENHGLKYCPCRITTGDFEADCKLICPCNFRIQQSYKQQGECWCGLFVKRVRQ